VRVVIDADVPNSVVEFLRSRGHEINLSRVILVEDSPDPLIAKTASDLRAVVVTWNRKHFMSLAKRRRGPSGPYTYPGMHLITFDGCTHDEGLKRLRELIDEIEGAYAVRVSQKEKRLIVLIGRTFLRFEDLP